MNVDIRLVGGPAEVAAAVAQLRQVLDVEYVSAPRPCRPPARTAVRVYVRAAVPDPEVRR